MKQNKRKEKHKIMNLINTEKCYLYAHKTISNPKQ